MLNYFLAEVNTVVSTTEAAAETTTTTSSSSSFGVSWILIYIVVIFAAMYFMSIRPQRKRQKELEQMRNQIKPGDSVLCNTGMYGRVVDVTAECYIIEFGMNKGVRVPVVKSEVAYVREPNLSNKAPEPVEEEKTGLFGRKKKKEEPKAETTTTTSDEVKENIEK